MKSLFLAVLMGGIILSVVSSCSTVPTRPLAPGEVRLLGIDFRGGRSINAYESFVANISFEAEGKSEIKRACFYLSGEGPNCFDAMYITFEPRRTFQVQLPGMAPGSYTVTCYVEYIQNGETRKTNVVTTQILVVSGRM
jgi:hypothetical protein